MEEVTIDEAPVAYAIDGPPGLAVTAAALGAFGPKPDTVVPGINAGINTGHSIIHSGTVGAALTARTFKMKGLALSLGQSDPWHWETAPVTPPEQPNGWSNDATPLHTVETAPFPDVEVRAIFDSSISDTSR